MNICGNLLIVFQDGRPHHSLLWWAAVHRGGPGLAWVADTESVVSQPQWPHLASRAAAQCQGNQIVFNVSTVAYRLHLVKNEKFQNWLTLSENINTGQIRLSMMTFCNLEPFVFHFWLQTAIEEVYKTSHGVISWCENCFAVQVVFVHGSIGKPCLYSLIVYWQCNRPVARNGRAGGLARGRAGHLHPWHVALRGHVRQYS